MNTPPKIYYWFINAQVHWANASQLITGVALLFCGLHTFFVTPGVQIKVRVYEMSSHLWYKIQKFHISGTVPWSSNVMSTYFLNKSQWLQHWQLLYLLKKYLKEFGERKDLKKARTNSTVPQRTSKIITKKKEEEDKKSQLWATSDTSKLRLL